MKKKGFTLIEIMIVLLVFSIGVLAVLKLILHNISTMNDLESRTTATFLAKEGIEIAYNTRDSNRLAELPRDCITNTDYDENIETNVCKYHFGDMEGQRAVEIDKGKMFRKPISQNNIEETVLFLNNDGPGIRYTHKTTNEPSSFKRYISFTGVKNSENLIASGNILKIESHVLYQRGTKTGEVLLEGFIGNY